MMMLYDGDVLLRERPDEITKNEECKPAWKMMEHAQLLDRITDLGVTGGDLLDVGCFSGLFLSNASKRGFGVSGVEPNYEAYLHVRDFWGFEVAHGNLGAADLSSERFSVIAFLDVIEHVSNPVSELKEALRLLRPGGLLILVTPNVKGLPQRAVKTKRWFTREPFCPIDDVPWHLWGFTRESLALCVERAGFIVKEISWLEPSPLSTNEGAGSSWAKRLGLRVVAEVSKRLGMSDRMALFATKL
jgi:SAM-dependent methyltransferase